MPTWLLIAIILIVGCFTSAYVTARICDKEFSSTWQTIKYIGNSIEPEYIYICKRCYYKADTKYGYCPNCGANMTNGEARHYYSTEIDLLSKLEDKE